MAEIKKVYKNGTAYDVLNSDTVGSALTAGTGIGISSNTISNTGVTSVNGSTGAVTVQETLVSGTNIKTVNGNSLLGSGDLQVGGITKVFTLPSTTSAAQDVYNRYVSGGNPILKYYGFYYIMEYGTSTQIAFVLTKPSDLGSSTGGTIVERTRFYISASNGTVTSFGSGTGSIKLSRTAPTTGSNSQVTLVI